MRRYLASRPEPRPLLVLVDGDAFEAGNLGRQACAVGDLGMNKAEALARVARTTGLAVQVVPDFVSSANIGHVVREGDLVLLAVDNHPARALIDRHVPTLSDATLISSGNDKTDGNVQLIRRRDGWSVDGHLVELHPEIRLRGRSCGEFAFSRPVGGTFLEAINRRHPVDGPPAGRRRAAGYSVV